MTILSFKDLDFSDIYKKQPSHHKLYIFTHILQTVCSNNSSDLSMDKFSSYSGNGTIMLQVGCWDWQTALVFSSHTVLSFKVISNG